MDNDQSFADSRVLHLKQLSNNNVNQEIVEHQIKLFNDDPESKEVLKLDESVSNKMTINEQTELDGIKFPNDDIPSDDIVDELFIFLNKMYDKYTLINNSKTN